MRLPQPQALPLTGVLPVTRSDPGTPVTRERLAWHTQPSETEKTLFVRRVDSVRCAASHGQKRIEMGWERGEPELTREDRSAVALEGPGHSEDPRAETLRRFEE
ncbi:hypothetical protein STEG23_020547 [Scotinomys teguina]